MRFAGRIMRSLGTQGQCILGDCLPNFRGFPAGTTVGIGYSASFTEKFMITESKPHGSGQFAVRLQGITSPEAVLKFKERGVFADEETLRASTDAQYFDDEIVGCRVVNRETGETLGTIKEIWETPANEIWVVDYKGKELPIPVIEEIVKHVNIPRKTVSIYVMPGLLEIVDDTSNDERDDDDEHDDGA
jgi:16S rRNA processing protein RimM